jgi:exopolysaccharide biosynthesis protein
VCELSEDELADFMETLGCVDALNLDGGGSSTFVYQDQVINQPTGDGDENDHNLRVLRPVSDAILIMAK